MVSDKQLLNSLRELVAQERLTLKKILEVLQEVYRRRLYADLGYSSLHKFLVKELGYSDSSAYRRIGALKLVERVPEAKTLIENGDLNLTVASKAESYTRGKTLEGTMEVLERVKGKTKDEATLEILSMKEEQGNTTAPIPREVKKRLTTTKTRIHLTLDNKTLEKLEKIKAIKKLKSEDALDYALEVALKEHEKSLTRINKSKGTKGRVIPAAVKKQAMKRANSCCEYPGCDEMRNLEFEHIYPFAKGGTHDLFNIKVFCRTHNQRAAILQFGQNKMDSYLRKR